MLISYSIGTFDIITTAIGRMHLADLAILHNVYCGVVARATMSKTQMSHGAYISGCNEPCQCRPSWAIRSKYSSKIVTQYWSFPPPTIILFDPPNWIHSAHRFSISTSIVRPGRTRMDLMIVCNVGPTAVPIMNGQGRCCDPPVECGRTSTSDDP